MQAWIPQLQFAPELLLKAQGIRAAIFDVDGVLTDGRLYISELGETLKTFHVQDGQGLKLLQQANIVPIIITGRDSAAVRCRVKDLGLAHALFGIKDKAPAAETVLSQLGLGWHEVAAMGDDWPDLPLMARARFKVAPAQAHIEVRAVVDYVTTLAGGQGAAREYCDLLLVASGQYAALLNQEVLQTLDTSGPTLTQAIA